MPPLQGFYWTSNFSFLPKCQPNKLQKIESVNICLSRSVIWAKQKKVKTKAL
jgi:hypothetical protein